jgi:hypothetical protein
MCQSYLTRMSPSFMRKRRRGDCVALLLPSSICLPQLLPQKASLTFCNPPVSTSFNRLLEKSLISLDLILDHGICVKNSVVSGVLSLPYAESFCALQMQLTPAASLPYDLVLGPDWLLLCHEASMHRSVFLTSGLVKINVSASSRFSLSSGSLLILSFLLASPSSTNLDDGNGMEMDVDSDLSPVQGLSHLLRSVTIYDPCSRYSLLWLRKQTRASLVLIFISTYSYCTAYAIYFTWNNQWYIFTPMHYTFTCLYL